MSTDALQQSLNDSVLRHKALHTTFASVNGRPIQMIAPTLALDIAVTDLREYLPAARESLVREYVAAAARRPFDLARGPLLRISLLRVDEREHVLLTTMRPIIADGWSRKGWRSTIAARSPS